MKTLVLLALLLIPTVVNADSLGVSDVTLTWNQPPPAGFTGFMEFWTSGAVSAQPGLLTGMPCPEGWCFWLGSEPSGVPVFTLSGMQFSPSVVNLDGHVNGLLHLDPASVPADPLPAAVPEPAGVMALGVISLALWRWWPRRR